ncbi:MAG TPA: transglutaminase-like domain-containing protein [Candidatus Polarisedimenticolia bacterium]|nr:transglutaminase-like domain-containing protein [Candidatus Polarisedimenticolia bacterium]
MTAPEATRVPTRPRLTSRSVLMILVAAALFLLVAQSEVVVVRPVHNGELPTASYQLREDDFSNPRLVQLREREKLDEVVAGSGTQFVTALRLMHWVRAQWEPAESFYYPPWDALEILDLARRHDNRGFCAQYAVVLLQACQSMGIHARYVDLPGHFVIAIWSDDFDRWALLDPLNDSHYERNGVPLRGRGLYRAYWEKDASGIEKVDGAGRRTPVGADDLNFFRLYSISMDANQLSAPVQVKVNGTWTTLAHAADYRTYPKVGRDELVVGSNFLEWRTQEATESFPERPETHDYDEFRYALNQTVILLANERMANRIVKVALVSGNSPTFARFLIRSSPDGDWVPSPTATVKWMLKPGANDMYARIETRFGWRAAPSQLRVYYKPVLFESLPALRGNILQLSWHRAEAN